MALHSDEFVIETILMRLRGESCLTVAQRQGVKPTLVESWTQSITRARCHIEAQRRYRIERAAQLGW